MKEECGKKYVAIGIVVLIVLAIVMILAFTVLKPKQVVSTVDSIEVHDMDIGFNVFTMSVNMNVTLDVSVSVKNLNVYGLKYYNGLARLNYRGQQIGEAPIPGGDISGGQTKGVNVTLVLMADRLLSSKRIYSDATANILPLNTFVRISGEVKILGFFKFHGNSTSSCNFNVHISDKTINNNVCRYKTEV
ncbi:unnamed protein product [Lathyrus oleraceus]|uniref:Late embryogenesis abundant protein LEA-2 subgroup domain-containing protein n=1 Tax=Pisum sativum TaxID=3888 RepID=A0A9D4Y174_PEA|nr:hypothetical protein KIW84_033859 [Pisum sativum]